MQFKEKPSLLSNLLKVPSCCSLGLLFILMDCVSYGSNLIEGRKELSMFVFLLSTTTAQIIYNALTSINAGIMGSSIVENFTVIRQIVQVCAKECQEDEVYCNTLICIFLGTMLFSLLSFLLMKYNLSQYLQLIPKSALTGCLGAIGLAQFSVAFGEIGYDLYDLKGTTKHVWTLLLLTTIVSIGAFLLQEKFSDVIFIIPLYSGLSVILYYTICYYGLKMDVETLRNNNHMPALNNQALFFDLLQKELNFKYFKLSAIVSNTSNIVSLALFSMIHLPINLPVYVFSTNSSANFNNEMKVQSIGNFFGAFCFSPVYFVCSNSIFFKRSGATSRFHGIALGLFTLLLFYYGTLIKSYIPFIFLAYFPFFIGISICYSTILEMKKGKKFDNLVIIITIVICTFDQMVTGLIIGIVLNMVWFIKQYIASLKIRNNAQPQEGINYASVDYILFFATINKFKRSISNLNKNKRMVIDLRGCYCFDWLGRDTFCEEILMLKKENRISLIGLPQDEFLQKFVEENEIEVFQTLEEIAMN